MNLYGNGNINANTKVVRNSPCPAEAGRNKCNKIVIGYVCKVFWIKIEFGLKEFNGNECEELNEKANSKNR